MSYLRRIFEINDASEEFYDENFADKDSRAMHGCRDVGFFDYQCAAPD